MHQDDLIPIEFLHEQLPSGFPPHKLILKIGMPVILLRNFDRRTKLTNGTRLIVTRITPKAVKVRNPLTNEEVYLPRMSFVDDKSPMKLHRHQFPLRAAFAMTINKSQGQHEKRCPSSFQNLSFLMVNCM
jgi:ATP-dependent DNA helicase PIF1